MDRPLVACVSFACALAAAGCSGGGGGAAVTSDPFGSEATPGFWEPAPATEPAPTTRPEAPGRGMDLVPSDAISIAELCSQACKQIQVACPGAAGGTECPAECARSAVQFPRCIAEFRSFVTCLGTAPIRCVGDDLDGNSCQLEAAAFGQCASSTITGD